MIDTHIHVLPGVDDGAVELSEAVEMCRQAAASGCTALIATPHQRHPTWWNAEPRRLEALVNQLQREIGDRIRLYLGAEIRLDPAFLKSLHGLKESGVLSLAGSSYLLVEFERRRIAVDPFAAVAEIRAAGWRPIVAHPEFIPGLCEDLTVAERLVEAGGLMQITSMSVTGDFSEQARRCVAGMLDAGLVHFVASDAHDTDWRPPGLYRARLAIAARWGRDLARRLTVENPAAVLENRDLPTVPATPERQAQPTAAPKAKQ